MKDKYTTDFFRGLYTRTYADGSEWLRATVPGLTREQLLPLLLRCIYIPEALAVGSSIEKLHTEAAELLLGRTFSLMGLDVVAPRRNSNCPDLAGISRRNNYRFVADAKCMRLSRGSVSHKNFDFYSLHEWRCSTGPTPEAEFRNGLTPVEVEIEIRPDEDDVFHFFADGVRRKVTGHVGYCLSGHKQKIDVSDGAAYIVPMYMLPRVNGAAYERCLDHDVTFLTWEHIYSLLRLGVTEESGLNLQDLFHVSKRIRKSRSTEKWRENHLPEEDRLVAEVAGVSVGSLRDGIQECMVAMRAMALEELEALPTVEDRRKVVRKMAQAGDDDLDILSDEQANIGKMMCRRPGLLRALQYCDHWDALRNTRS